MENLIGAFVVLVGGLGFCMVMTAIEFMNEVRNIVVREQVCSGTYFYSWAYSILHEHPREADVAKHISLRMTWVDEISRVQLLCSTWAMIDIT